jgi:hypothetical protein
MQTQLASSATAPAPRIGNFAGVISLFKTASTSLKYPKIRLRTPEGITVCLNICGEKSQYQGAINLTNGDGYPGIWWGRIELDGRITISRDGQRIYQQLTKLLERLSHEPAQTAAEYGKLTGRCTFCDRPLEDEKSTAVGYGPTCAKSFKLPWGKTPTLQTELI